jgi:hypothetical protein
MTHEKVVGGVLRLLWVDFVFEWTRVEGKLKCELKK